MKPTVGLMCYYYIKGMPHGGTFFTTDPEAWSEPCAATVAGICKDGSKDNYVNLSILGNLGNRFSMQRVLFLDKVDHNKAHSMGQDRYCTPITVAQE